jgi:Fe-S cluster assembly protein SufD
MTVERIRTKAELGLLEQFSSAAGHLPGRTWMPAVRAAAMAAFERDGLPSRRVEAWKYTDLRALMKEALPVPVPGAKPTTSAQARALANAGLGPALAGLVCVRLVFVDGVFQMLEGMERLQGVECGVSALAESLDAPGFDWLKTHFTATPTGPHLDPAVLLNTAFVRDGAMVRVGAGAALPCPLHLVFVTSGKAPSANAVRNLVLVEAGASATILESHVGIGPAPAQTNAVTMVHVEKGANVHHLQLLSPAAGGMHLGTWFVDLETDARYHATQISLSPQLARNQGFVTFNGEDTEATFNAVALGRGSEHIDTTLVIDHAVPRCTSRETMKTVLDDHARGVFQAKVIVRPDAQKSDGKQLAKALLLSSDAEFDAKPELEIYADDVVCGHGATSGEIDDEQLFYLRARGIPAAEARAMLVQAFVMDVLDAVQHEGIRDALHARAADWLVSPAAGVRAA